MMTSAGTLRGQQPVELLRKEWGWIALRGVCAVIFGILTLLVPGVTLGVLVIVWGAYALIDGVVALSAGCAFATTAGRSGR